MNQRITELYRPGNRVVIRFAHDEARRWWPGRVVRLEPPGVWVETPDGQQWFVTNRQRIRHHG